MELLFLACIRGEMLKLPEKKFSTTKYQNWSLQVLSQKSEIARLEIQKILGN